MKLHEVIIKLVNNRDKGLMFKDAAGRIATLETGEFCVRFKGEKSIIDVDEDWEEIKQPVPWQEAIAAWVNGKKVRCVDEDGHTNAFSCEDACIPLYKCDIGTSVWYIED